MAFLRRAPAAPPRQTFRLRAPKALTASSVSVGVQDAREADAKSHAPVGGQLSRIERALGFYDTLGEVRNPSQFFSHAMRRIRYFPAILDENGEPQEVEDEPLRGLFERIHDPGTSGMQQLAASYGTLSFVIGDGNLVVSEQEDEEVWEYLSPVEFKKLRGTSPQEYERNNGLEKKTLVEAGDLESVAGDKVRVWRLWRRHPARSGWSDSPVLSILGLYALLESMTLAAGATSGNRAALRDMLYIPDEVTLIGGSDPNDPGVDEDPLEDSFLREFIEALETAIKDPSSVEAISPLLARGPAVFQPDGGGNAIPYADLIKRIQLGRDNPYFETEAWQQVIERIALGLDMPNEMVTGTGQANHWSGWLLDEQGFRQHIAPCVEEFCADLASAYLRPAAKADGIADWQNVVIWYDPVNAVAHPDAGPTAMDAWKVGAVGREYVRAGIGAEDGDAPTPEDEAFLLELLGRRPATDPNAQDGETAPQDGGTGGDTTEAPPAEPVDAQQNGNAVTASSDFHAAALIAMVSGAGEMMVRQARKAAGARLVQRSKNCGECQDAIRDVPHGLVASTLGPVRVREIISGHTTEERLVGGVGDLFAEQVREFGVRDPFAVQLGTMVESHALRTLYEGDSPRLPKGFADMVEKALR